MLSVFTPFEQWLNWITSHDGRLFRRGQGQTEPDSDLLCLIPTPPGQTPFTVGDLRALVAAVQAMEANACVSGIGHEP
mgnify:CR=1 FL=1